MARPRTKKQSYRRKLSKAVYGRPPKRSPKKNPGVLYRVELMNPKTPSRRSVKFVRASSRDEAIGIAVKNLTKWKMGKYRITGVAQSTAPDYGVSDNPVSRLRPNRLTPVRFSIKGKIHTGKAKLVGGRVKVFVTPEVARKINPNIMGSHIAEGDYSPVDSQIWDALSRIATKKGTHIQNWKWTGPGRFAGVANQVTFRVQTASGKYSRFGPYVKWMGARAKILPKFVR